MATKQIEFFDVSAKTPSGNHHDVERTQTLSRTNREPFPSRAASASSFHKSDGANELGEGETSWLTSPVVAKPSLNSNRLSRDEMNLAEFPLSVLSTRVSPGKKTLEFEDSVIDKNGNPIKRQWIITAADKFGLPTSSDDEVLLGLLKISVDRGLNERRVYFTRYELLKTLNWSTEGRSYKRLTNALDRLSGVRIKASNSFYDNDSKSFSTRNFGIIDEYEINSGKSQNPKPSFFVWSEVLHKSFSSGFIKKLDFDFFLNLESAVSKRLYRFLDKHFWYRAKFSMNLFTLAHEKIGVSRTYKYPSSLRQQIDPAVEELVKAGFLSHVDYQGRGKATEIIFYAAPDHGRRSQKPQKRVSEGRREEGAETLRGSARGANSGDAPTRDSWILAEQEPSSQDDLLFEQICQRGVHETQARRLVEAIFQSGSEQRAQEILNHFDQLIAEGSPRVSRNAPGFLFRALEKPTEFSLPGERAGGTTANGEMRSARARAESGNQAFSQQRPRQQSSSERLNPNRLEKEQYLQTEYLKERKRELVRLRGELEPSIVKKLESEVREALEKIKGLVTESGFEETVQHGVEEKIAKLCVIPDFDEWLKARNKGNS